LGFFGEVGSSSSGPSISPSPGCFPRWAKRLSRYLLSGILNCLSTRSHRPPPTLTHLLFISVWLPNDFIYGLAESVGRGLGSYFRWDTHEALALMQCPQLSWTKAAQLSCFLATANSSWLALCGESNDRSGSTN